MSSTNRSGDHRLDDLTERNQARPLVEPFTDLAHDVLRSRSRPLDALFAPRVVAVLGATERPGSVGRALLSNLIGHPFGGAVYPVNPGRRHVLGIRAAPRVADVPEPVDLAIIATPADRVPDLIGQCLEIGVGAAVVLADSLAAPGSDGPERQRALIASARRGRMRILGPHSLGVIRPSTGLHACASRHMPRAGQLACVTQSAAMGSAILDWSRSEDVGFSTFVTLGPMLDVGWGDLIDYLGDDPATQSIVLAMESVGQARHFLSAAREVALTKPIIVLKSGRSPEGARLAASLSRRVETAQQAELGRDEVLDAALDRSGVLRVDTVSRLFAMAEVLAKQPRPSGPRLAIVTNAGGPAVLATDTLIDGGGQLAQLHEMTRARLDELMPETSPHDNPLDVLADATPTRIARAVDTLAEDPEVDGLLVILAPQAETDPTASAHALQSRSRIRGKPILASWMGGERITEGTTILNRAGVPTFAYPDIAARTFTLMWRYTQNLRSLYQTPTLSLDDGQVDCQAAHRILQKARDDGRTQLLPTEAHALLENYRIRTDASDDSTAPNNGSESEDRDRPRLSPSMSHGPPTAIVLSLISRPDPQFGPVLEFAAGGELLEIFDDRALGLPPLNSTLARRMIDRTRISRVLRGWSGRPAIDLPELEQILVRFSQLIVEQPIIREARIRSLLVTSDRLVAQDVEVELYGSGVEEVDLPKPAIRPYPTQYVEQLFVKNKRRVTVRPIRPEDEPAVVKFHRTLSERTVFLRYFHPLSLSQRVAHDRLTRICYNDYDREMALVVTWDHPLSDPVVATNSLGDGADTEGRTESSDRPLMPDSPDVILAIGRLSKEPGTQEAELSALVSDQYQGLGIGTVLVTHLIAIGRAEGLQKIHAAIHTDNREMQGLCRKVGFQIEHDFEEGEVRAWIDLKTPVL